MPQQQLDLFNTKDSIDLHNIARRVENNSNLYGVGYSIRAVADRLSEYKKPDSESWYEP